MRRAPTFAGTALIFFGLDLVGLATVILLLSDDGPADIAAILIGGVLGEYGFLLTRSCLRKQILAGSPAPEWISSGGPKLRGRLLRAYSPVPTVLLTMPYFLAMAAYGLWSLPWPPVHSWEGVLGAGLFSAAAAACLANAAQWLCFSWLVGRIKRRSA